MRRIERLNCAALFLYYCASQWFIMELDTACKGGLYKSKESQLTTSDNTTMDYYGLLGRF